METVFAVKGVTLSTGSMGFSPQEISQVTYLLTLVEQFACKADGDEIASTEIDVKQHG